MSEPTARSLATALQISDYLLLGCHHNTSEGQRRIALLIDAQIEASDVRERTVRSAMEGGSLGVGTGPGAQDQDTPSQSPPSQSLP